MKKLLGSLLILIFLCGGAAFAEDTVVIDDSPVYLLSPIVESMGGSNVPIASGFESLFTNPAGLSRKGGQLTFASVNVGPYFVPTEQIIDLWVQAIQGSEEMPAPEDAILSILEDLDLESGVGTNANIGLGLAAFGLGLGFLTDVDMLITQEGTALSLYVDPVVTSALVAGISHGFGMGNSKLHIGADARGIVRLRPSERLSVTEVASLLSESSEGGDFDPASFPFDMSIGYGFDAGAILEMGKGFTIGAAVNNIGGTELVTSSQTMAEIETAVTTGSGPMDLYEYLTGDPVAGYTYVIPMSITGGFGYDSPAKELMDFKFTAEYTHTFWNDPENIENDSIWKNIHLGAEINLLRMLKVRGGINQGYITFGGGLNLLVLEVNAAYYSREMGNYAGQNQNQAFIVGAKVKL